MSEWGFLWSCPNLDCTRRQARIVRFKNDYTPNEKDFFIRKKTANYNCRFCHKRFRYKQLTEKVLFIQVHQGKVAGYLNLKELRGSDLTLSEGEDLYISEPQEKEDD